MGRLGVASEQAVQCVKLLLPAVKEDGAVERHRSRLFVQRLPELYAIRASAARPL